MFAENQLKNVLILILVLFSLTLIKKKNIFDFRDWSKSIGGDGPEQRGGGS